MKIQRALGLGLGFALCVGVAGCLVPILDLGGLGRSAELTEKELEGSGDAKVVLIEVEGVIAYQESGVDTLLSFSREPGMVARLHEALGMAERDDDVVAMVLRIRSPGGDVAASETVHHLIAEWKSRTGRPVVAYLQGIAASGGYYVAMASDEVVAHPTAVTGSIGVIMPGVNLSGLMDKIGVEDQSITSGPFKNTGTMLRPMREEEKAQLQGVVDDLHARFVSVVDTGRPKLAREQVESLADGRIYTAGQALEDGLVDRVGHIEVALARARELAGVGQATVVTYSSSRLAPNRYSRFWTAEQDETPAVRAEASVVPRSKSELPAGFYYLWPEALGR